MDGGVEAIGESTDPPLTPPRCMLHLKGPHSPFLTWTIHSILHRSPSSYWMLPSTREGVRSLNRGNRKQIKDVALSLKAPLCSSPPCVTPVSLMSPPHCQQRGRGQSGLHPASTSLSAGGAWSIWSAPSPGVYRPSPSLSALLTKGVSVRLQLTRAMVHRPPTVNRKP